MTLISQSFPSLIGGVSQQAPSQRLPTQVEFQENCLNSITQGMRKRPNTVYLSELDVGDGSLNDAYIHQIKRDRYEQYILTIKPSGISVYDRNTGFSYPVVNQSNANNVSPVNYLKLSGEAENSRMSYQALTSADTTYILNKTQPVMRTTGIVTTADGFKREAITIGHFNYPDASSYERLYEEDFYRDPYDPYNKYNRRVPRQPLASYKFSDGNTYFLEETENTSPSEIAQKVKEHYESDPAYADYKFYVSSNIIYVDYPETLDPIPLYDFSYAYTRLVIDQWYPTDYEVISRKETSAAINLLSEETSALCHVRQADYNVTYRLHVNGMSFSHTTPEATAERARAGLSIQSIMSSIVSKVNASSAPIEAQLGNGYFTVKTSDGSELSVSADDDLNGQAFVAVHEKAQLFSDLPSKAPDGFLVKIVGSVEDEGNGYWVKFIQTGEGGQGHWEESRAPDEMHILDATSMPHVMVRDASEAYISPDNPLGIHFVFKEAEWDEREVGDNDATPFPSFVSEWDFENNVPTQLRYIHAMTFHKNRLVFASDENIIFSEAGNYWNFFRTTAQTIKDSDPIDISVLSQVVNPIKGMVSAQKELILYGSRQQYSLKSGDIFSAATVWADPIASYDVDLSAQPQYVGNSVFFVVNREKFNGIFESHVQDEQHEAMDVTAHVPEYVGGRIRKLAPSGSEDVLLVLPDTLEGEGSEVYQYSHKTQGTEKVHSAWNTWTFKQDVLDIEIEGSVAYMVTHLDGKYYCEVMNLSEDSLRDNLGVPVFLDQRQEIPTESTTPEGMSEVVYKGRKFVGYPYVQRTILTQIYLRDGNNRTVQTGRLQLRRLTLNFDETTSFDVKVKQEAREERVTHYEGRVLGSVTQRIGRIPVDSGTLTVPLFGRAKGMVVEIFNDSPFDCRIQSGEWEGLYHNRARRS
jgi:hypothetical protein